MKLLKYFPIILLVIACAVVSIACSNGKSPVTPSSEDISGISNDLPISFGSDFDSRSLLAVYDAVIDPESKTFTVTPDTRTAQYHFPLNQLYPNVLEITGFGWTPNFWADIKLIHPFPGSGIKGYDPRVIAILPANAGVRFIYPSLGVGGNNAVVLEPDGYTNLFDSLAGSIPGNVNPFKAYFKDWLFRVWSGTGITEETQKWQMNLAGFGGPLQFKLVVDVSTNYSNPPQPITDNAPEPVKIDATVRGPGLTTDGGSAGITVTLLDWQGPTDIGGVRVESPALFNGTVSLVYSAPGPNPEEYIYTGTLTNPLLAPVGTYKILVAAWDQPTGIYMYNEFTVSVSDATDEGNLIWAKRAGGASDDGGQGITTLSDNSTVVTGNFTGSTTFGPLEPNQTVLTSSGAYDIFIARYNPDGMLEWAKRAGGSYDDDIGYGITTLSDNSTVVTGFFKGSATFGPLEPSQTILNSAGYTDIFIARYNPDGTLAWAKRAGGTNVDVGLGTTTLSDNSTVVTGYFRGTATFGPDEINQTVLTTSGDNDIFIARYNPDGTLAWAKQAGGSIENHEMGNGVTTLSDNSTVVTGRFYGLATFGHGEPNETILSSLGDSEIFIAKYNPDGTLAWAKSARGQSSDGGNAITTLSDDSTVVTGWFSFEALFGSGESNQTILTSAGYYDFFIARYNPDGTLAWVKRAGGSSNEDVGLGITTLSDDSTVVIGWFGLMATFGPNEPNQTVLTSTGDHVIFIAKYNPDDGTLAWVKSAGGSYLDQSEGITTLSDDSTVVTGWFNGTETFGSGEPDETVLSTVGGSDIFVARFKP